MKDELSPISGGYRNAFGGWAATLVDTLDTLHITGMAEKFGIALTAIKDIDFSVSTEETLNVFETTIRYLGGLLSAYDLSGERVLIEKAVEVGEMLYVAFDTPNRMPVARWELEKGRSGRCASCKHRDIGS
jgi:mannosyl-oligosaccharide alpha-1,2-mannosidase